MGDKQYTPTSSIPTQSDEDEAAEWLGIRRCSLEHG